MSFEVGASSKKSEPESKFKSAFFSMDGNGLSTEDLGLVDSLPYRVRDLLLRLKERVGFIHFCKFIQESESLGGLRKLTWN